MTDIVGIISRCGLRFDVCSRNQHNRNSLAMYNPLLLCASCLEQLYMSNNSVNCCRSYLYKALILQTVMSLCELGTGHVRPMLYHFPNSVYPHAYTYIDTLATYTWSTLLGHILQFPKSYNTTF